MKPVENRVAQSSTVKQVAYKKRWIVSHFHYFVRSAIILVFFPHILFATFFRISFILFYVLSLSHSGFRFIKMACQPEEWKIERKKVFSKYVWQRMSSIKQTKRLDPFQIALRWNTPYTLLFAGLLATYRQHGDIFVYVQHLAEHIFSA